MSVITLTSDYGMLDYRVSAIKGSILSLNKDAKIVDISHEIQAYNLQQTAYIVHNAFRYFPKGSVHIISVDSFYHKDRKYLIYKVKDQYFLAADNGVLGLIFYDQKPDSIHEITLGERYCDEVSFVVTDVLVPVAVHLQNGGVPDVVGKKIDDVREISLPRASYNAPESMIVGEVMYIDHFGNVVSNITKNLFDEILPKFQKFEIKFRNMTLKKVYKHYTEIVSNWENETDYHGKAVAIFNPLNLLEITIYKGNKNSGANSLFGLSVGEKIYISFS